MGMDPRKIAAEWFYNTVFKEESIRPRPVQKQEQLPAMLRTARSLENGPHQNWQSRESVFLKQAKLLANYEDEYDYKGNVLRYYPTYQALTDAELRGYFSWRTALRRGEVRKTSLSFAFLYIYELLNQIGVSDALDGWHKLTAFRDAYGQLDSSILPYLKRWTQDYVVYYGLDPALLADRPQAALDRSVTVLAHIQEVDGPAAAEAVEGLSSRWLARSKFYAGHRQDMDEVIVRVLRRMSAHYAKCKKTLVEQYFGSCVRQQVWLFDTAVFCNPLKRREYEYTLNEQCVYRCKKGLWTVQRYDCSPQAVKKLETLLKTIDAVMRQELDYRHPVQPGMDTKWIIQAIQEETRSLLAERQAAEEKKITIDYAQLTRIRQDAAVTQEKLIVEEEAEEPALPAPREPEPVPPVPQETAAQTETPLSGPEYRLLQCLLYGGDTGWVRSEGHMLSVLVDGINDKLYDTFLDSVLDETPELVEDYIDDLKEMVHP